MLDQILPAFMIPRLQFRMDCYANAFEIIGSTKQDPDGWTYARVKWAYKHSDTLNREFIIRFRTAGDLYKGGFQVYVAWTDPGIPGIADKKHWYSSIPTGQMDAFWNSIGAPGFNPGAFEAHQFSGGATAGSPGPWLLDLVDTSLPPSSAPLVS